MPQQFLSKMFPGVNTQILKLWLRRHREFCRKLVHEAPSTPLKRLERWIARLDEELGLYEKSSWASFHQEGQLPYPQWLREQIIDQLIVELARKREKTRKQPRYDVGLRRSIVARNQNLQAIGLCYLFDSNGIPLPPGMQNAGGWERAYRKPIYRHRVESIISKDRSN